MGINDIKLEKSTVELLYKKSLIGDKKEANQEISSKLENASNEKISFFGKYNKKVLILVNEPNEKYIGDDSLQFLTKVIGACNLTLEDIAIVNVGQYSFLNSEQINQQLEPKYLLSFGPIISELNYPFNIPVYQAFSHNKIAFLQANSLATIMKNPEEKKLLWANLIKIFNIQ